VRGHEPLLPLALGNFRRKEREKEEKDKEQIP
jgi:hypothetical protein